MWVDKYIETWFYLVSRIKRSCLGETRMRLQKFVSSIVISIFIVLLLTGYSSSKLFSAARKAAGL